MEYFLSLIRVVIRYGENPRACATDDRTGDRVYGTPTLHDLLRLVVISHTSTRAPEL
jgi:hypothetical protein